ncbi:MAG: zf-TFIIB domain-containing protein [Polyangiales bacterium]
MSAPILCAQCGASLPAHAASVAATCTFCGTTSAPRPRVVERVVERVVVVAAEPAPAESSLPACPRCAKAMSQVRGGGVEVLACGKCGGALLTPEQLLALQRERNDELARAVQLVSLVYGRLEPRSAVLSCPTCQGPLRLEEIEGSVHLIHVCDAHGTFFEQSALDTYIDLWSERRVGEIDDETLESMGVRRKGFFGFFKG